MAEHKYAQVLRWIADGEEVQGRISEGPWGGMGDFTSEHATLILKGKPHPFSSYEFRIKPRTITIAGREIEAPIDQIKSGEQCYCTDSTGAMTAIRFAEEEIKHRGALACGRLFSTPEAARDAFDAVTSLLLPDGK